MKFSKVLLLLTTVTLAACDTKRNPYFNDEEAQFRVTSVNVLSTQSLGRNSFGHVNQVRYDLSVCIQDLTQTPVPPRLKFDIVVGSETISRQTTEDGCLNWTREIGFDPNKQEKFYILTTTIVGSGELRGRLRIDIALNPWRRQFIDLRKNPDAIPATTEVERVRPESDSFKLKDISSAPRNERSGKETPEATPESNVLPQSNAFSTESGPTNSTLRMAINGSNLRKIRLDPRKPYTVDRNLTLTTHEIFEFGVQINFFVSNFEHPETQVAPRNGRFKVSLAIIEEPDYEIDDLWKFLDRTKTVRSLLVSQEKSRWLIDLQVATVKLMSEKKLHANSELSLNLKRRIVAKALVPYVIQTKQFETEMDPQIGIADTIRLSFSRLAQMKDRVLLAYSVQPLSPDIQMPIKADGLSYAPNGLYGGWGAILKKRVEADLIYKEHQTDEETQDRFNPFSQYLATFKNLRGDNRLRLTDVGPLPKNSSVITFLQEYDFKSNFEKFIQDTQNISSEAKMNFLEKRRFLAAICQKYFDRPEFHARKTNVLDCTISPEYFLDLKVLEFVERGPGDRVEKVAETLTRTLSVTANFQKTNEHSISSGASTSARAGMSFDVPGLDGYGMSLNLGHEWFYTEGISQGTSTSVTLSNAVNFSLNVEESAFRIRPVVRKCIQALLKPRENPVFIGLRKDIDGILICADKGEVVERIENYYIITQACDQNARTADCSAPVENRFRMVVRGAAMFNMFKNLVDQNAVSVFSLRPIPHEAIRHEINNWEELINAFDGTKVSEACGNARDASLCQRLIKADAFLTSQFFPGVIVRPINLD